MCDLRPVDSTTLAPFSAENTHETDIGPTNSDVATSRFQLDFGGDFRLTFATGSCRLTGGTAHQLRRGLNVLSNTNRSPFAHRRRRTDPRGAPRHSDVMDHYADEVDDPMSRATDLPKPHPHPRTGAPDLRGKHVCPFCGSVNAQADDDVAGHAGPCPKCSMADTPATRKATKARIGPWFVRQTRNPAAPGMRFDTLLALVKRGQVTAQSVVRGPTTHQLWRFASQVKGLSRAFGVCYSCGGSVGFDATLCPHCNRMQEPPANPDVLLEGAISNNGGA